MIVKTKAGDFLEGFFLGTVVLHLHHGLLKVYIPSVYPPEWKNKPEKLPICTQVTPLFAGSHNGNGVFSYPNIGSTVVCGFANNDLNLPFVIGSYLGTPNAFGLYELIKKRKEDISNRHLITSGNTLIELYESGKLSAIVETPSRRDADVDFTNLSVENRPLLKKVDDYELSNVNCQIVLDNYYNCGELSTSTHFYDIDEQDNLTQLSDTLETIAEKYKLSTEVDTFRKLNNDGNIVDNLTRSYEVISSYNYLNPNTLSSVDSTLSSELKEYLLNEYLITGLSQNDKKLKSKDIINHLDKDLLNNVIVKNNISTELNQHSIESLNLSGDKLLSSEAKIEEDTDFNKADELLKITELSTQNYDFDSITLNLFNTFGDNLKQLKTKVDIDKTHTYIKRLPNDAPALTIISSENRTNDELMLEKHNRNAEHIQLSKLQYKCKNNINKADTVANVIFTSLLDRKDIIENNNNVILSNSFDIDLKYDNNILSNLALVAPIQELQDDKSKTSLYTGISGKLNESICHKIEEKYSILSSDSFPTTLQVRKYSEEKELLGTITLTNRDKITIYGTKHIDTSLTTIEAGITLIHNELHDLNNTFSAIDNDIDIKTERLDKIVDIGLTKNSKETRQSSGVLKLTNTNNYNVSTLSSYLLETDSSNKMTILENEYSMTDDALINLKTKFYNSKSNAGTIDILNNCETKINLKSQNNTGILIDSENKKTNIHYVNDVSTKTGNLSVDIIDNKNNLVLKNELSADIGKFEITIRDTSTGSKCVFSIDKHGKAALYASDYITMTAPNITINGYTTINGKTHITDDTTIDTDAKIGGVSYNKHTHYQVMPAHLAGKANVSTRH